MESSQYVRASRIISRNDVRGIDEADESELQEIAEPPASPDENPSVDQVMRNVMAQVHREIRHCVETGQPVESILRQRWTPRRRNRHARVHRDTGTSGDENRCDRASSRVPDWSLTPHAVTVRRGMQTAPQLQVIDDSRLRQAYNTAVWRQRAQRFNIALDMEDPIVQESLLQAQDLAHV